MKRETKYQIMFFAVGLILVILAAKTINDETNEYINNVNLFCENRTGEWRYPLACTTNCEMINCTSWKMAEGGIEVVSS